MSKECEKMHCIIIGQKVFKCLLLGYNLQLRRKGPMANKNLRHPQNIPGKYYCTDPNDDTGEGCIACNVCYTGAPDFFAEDEEGNAYVKKQPETPADILLCRDQMEACPVASIGDDG